MTQPSIESPYIKISDYPEDATVVSGRFFELPEDEYIQVEKGTDGAVVLWSSTLGMLETFEKFSESLGNPEGVFIDEHGEPDIVHMIHDKTDTFRAYGVFYGDIELNWQAPRVKLNKGTIPHVELSLSGTTIDTALLERLLEVTGSPQIIEKIGQCLAPVAEFVHN